MKLINRREEVKKVNYFYWLDWLRFISCLVVVVGHVRGAAFEAYGSLEKSYQTPVIAVAFALSRLGLEAVILFFVLSGFLVGGRSLHRANQGLFKPGPYILDRITRVYVPLLPALVFTGFVWHLFGGAISVRTFIANILGLQGSIVENFGENAPLWSLAYEIWFYVLWLGVLMLIRGNGLANRVIGWILIITSLSIFTKLEAVYLYCWLLGAGFFVVKPALGREACLIGSSILIGVGLILSQLASDSSSLRLGWAHEFLPSLPVALLILSVGFCGFVKTVSVWKPITLWVSSFEKMGTTMAAFSYTLYLTHYPVIGLWSYFYPNKLRSLDVKSLIQFAQEILLCFLIACFFYILFERNTATVRRCLRGIIPLVKKKNLNNFP